MYMIQLATLYMLYEFHVTQFISNIVQMLYTCMLQLHTFSVTQFICYIHVYSVHVVQVSVTHVLHVSEYIRDDI